MLYEVRYESSVSSGYRLVRATSPEAALAIFAEEWSEDGDEAPSAWVAGCWSETA